MAHAVGFHPERIVESVRRHVFKIIGAVGVGCAVQVRSADFLHRVDVATRCVLAASTRWRKSRSEEHTSELQSRGHLVCRLLLEKKKKKQKHKPETIKTKPRSNNE